MRYAIVLAVLVATGSIAYAHPGGVDGQGGHFDGATDIYHCHREDCVEPRLRNERPTAGPDRYGTATGDAMMEIHAVVGKTFYCGCDFQQDKTIDFGSCPYEPVDQYENRKKVEQEHVVPAAAFGHYRACWQEPEECKLSDGSFKRNRDCCRDIDLEFRKAEADLHNFRPAIGQINALRSDTPFGIVPGEDPLHLIGGCDFEIKDGVAEPTESIRGEIARTYLYMMDTWGMPLTVGERDMFEQWNTDDPVNDIERIINRKICRIQRNSNPYVERLVFDQSLNDCRPTP